jgi:diguanylate cyclase (GGDEF)-like protein/PAS domain S-box-containing protein
MDEVLDISPDGLAVISTADGRVTTVLSDTTPLSRPPLVGEPLDRIVIAEQQAKMQAFFGQLAREDAVFDWAMNVDTPEGVVLLDFVGSATPDGYLVMAAATKDGVADFAEQFMSANSELITLVRDLRKRDATSSRVLVETTELNNLLIQMQRELARKNADLEHSQRLLESILSATPDLVYIYDLEAGRCTYANDGLERLLGFSVADAAQILADPDSFLLEDVSRQEAATWRLQVESASEDDVIEREYRTKDASGEWRWLAGRDKVLRRDEDGRPLQVLSVVSDVTRRRQLESDLKRQATTDELTGAANRRRFLQAGIDELGRARRYERPLSILMLDLDGLKHINDTWGHAAGDKAITRFASTCRDNLRATDLFARFGGDEFVVLMPETDLVGARDVGVRIAADLVARKLNFEGQQIPVTACVGVASFHTPDDTLDTLIGRADEALYRAKASGVDRVQVERPPAG